MSWDRRFLSLAEHVSSWSKDPSTKVGAVLVDEKRIVIGLGYNGFPRGIVDYESRYADREKKYKLVVHAEVNALLNATRATAGSILYLWPFAPCERCAGVIIQAGVARVVAPKTIDNPRWAESFRTAGEMFEEAGVAIDIRMLHEF